MTFTMRSACLAAATLVAGLVPQLAAAWEINVGNYGFAPTAMPFAVAVEEGFFDKQGVKIDGIRNAPGGNAVRLMATGDIAMSFGGLPEVIGGRQAGLDLWIVNDDTHNVGGVDWVVMPDSPIKSIKDFKGKRLSYTAPHSITQAWSSYIVKAAGLQPGDMELISAGGISAGLSLLESGGTDIAVIDLTNLAKNPDKYRVVLEGTDSSVWPAMNGTVGFTTKEMMTDHPDVIRGINAAKREAVQFMHQNPEKAAEDIAKQYKADPKLVLGIIQHLMDKGAVGDTQFFGEGNFDMKAMQTTVDLARLVEGVSGDIDLASMVDESFLPDDLQSKK